MFEGISSAVKEDLPAAHRTGYGILPQHCQVLKPYKHHRRQRSEVSRTQASSHARGQRQMLKATSKYRDTKQVFRPEAGVDI